MELTNALLARERRQMIIYPILLLSNTRKPSLEVKFPNPTTTAECIGPSKSDTGNPSTLPAVDPSLSVRYGPGPDDVHLRSCLLVRWKTDDGGEPVISRIERAIAATAAFVYVLRWLVANNVVDNFDLKIMLLIVMLGRNLVLSKRYREDDNGAGTHIAPEPVGQALCAGNMCWWKWQ